MSLPLIDLATAEPEALLHALRTHGATRVVHAALDGEVLAAAQRFFALPDAEKSGLDIRHSPHFRGYSRMHNERDFREQIHFGRETAPVPTGAPCDRLAGPNLWPRDPAWRARLLDYLASAEVAATRALELLARALGHDAGAWLGSSPYVLLKLIGYHAQERAGTAPRRGVAAHLDFSLLTLTLQDDVGGLDVQGPDGVWVRVAPREHTWMLHVGELLPYVLGAGGGLVATPHRVLNLSTSRMRCSLPFFLSPSLDTVLVRGSGAVAGVAGEHVHAVLAGTPPAKLHYGEAEWRRKGENVWCATCCTGAS